jgi:putative oxidoreductase
MSISEHISPLVGRVLIAWFFLSEVLSRIEDWEGSVELMHMRHVPNAHLLLALALVVMALGAVSLILGYYTRQGALLLFAYTVIVTVLMHDYWRIENTIERSADYELFIRNLAVAGGLLFLVGMGPGPFAIDNRPQGKPRR